MDRIKKILRINIILWVLILSAIITKGQGLNIKTGATMVNKGNLILKGDWINEGTFADTSAMVIFSGTTQTIGGTSASAFNNLTISSGSTTSIISAGQTLDRILLCNGTLNGGGFLTLKSTAKRTALINGTGTGQVPGNVTMQRYLPSGFGYKYFSSPFQASTVSEFGDDMNLAAPFTPFYRYDENRIIGGTPASGWVSYKTTTNLLNPLAGYAVNFGSDPAAKTVDVTGVVNNGNLSFTLYNNNNPYTTGYNLIGNPYPSPIDWDAISGWTKTSIDNALYYFKASTTDQYGGTYSTYIGGVSSDGLATSIIPSMQGFFVHVSTGSYPVTGTLTLDNRVRVTDMTHAFMKKSDEDNSIPLLRLAAKFDDDPASVDPMVIYFDEKAEEEFDSNFDALKLMNTDLKVPNLYAISADGKKLSINALPFYYDTPCTVPLGIKTNKAGNIVFKISFIDDELKRTGIYLNDKLTGTNQNLLTDKEYRLYLDAGEYTDRFSLFMTSIPTEIPEVVPENEPLNILNFQGILKAEINLSNGEEGTLIISNLAGQILFITKVHDSGYFEFNPIIRTGLYIVTLTSGNKRISKKITFQK